MSSASLEIVPRILPCPPSPIQLGQVLGTFFLDFLRFSGMDPPVQHNSIHPGFAAARETPAMGDPVNTISERVETDRPPPSPTHPIILPPIHALRSSPSPLPATRSRCILSPRLARIGWICPDSAVLTSARPYFRHPCPFVTSPRLFRTGLDLPGCPWIWPSSPQPVRVSRYPCPLRHGPRLARTSWICLDYPGLPWIGQDEPDPDRSALRNRPSTILDLSRRDELRSPSKPLNSPFVPWCLCVNPFRSPLFFDILIPPSLTG